jgi:hypothetical protein
MFKNQIEMRGNSRLFSAVAVFAVLSGTCINGYAMDPVANACPAEGCEIKIAKVSKSGGELDITFEANFLPDVSRNHIHIYWDTFTAGQVSSDAEANGLTQGDWVPTDVYPKYTTSGTTSIANRNNSKTMCVTAANRDHAVFKPIVFHCIDVSSHL